MVRRWSYLNSINRSFWLKPLYQHVERHVKGYNLTTFKGTTFFRNSLYLTAPTKLSRKSFYRRRHLNNFLFYFNIISAWSQEYLFFKKLNKTLLMFGFYKNLYLAQNTLLFSKKINVWNYWVWGFKDNVSLYFVNSLHNDVFRGN